MNRSIRYHFTSFGTCRTMTCLEINKNRSVKYNRTVTEAYTTVLSKTNSTTIRGDRIKDLSIKRLCCYPVLFGSVAPHGHIVRSIFFYYYVPVICIHVPDPHGSSQANMPRFVLFLQPGTNAKLIVWAKVAITNITDYVGKL